MEGKTLKPGELETTEHRLFVLFKRAIDSEREAQRMYEEALECCSSPLLRELLEKLRDDEVQHEHDLLRYYHELRMRYETTGEAP
jgi:rubrerythrin